MERIHFHYVDGPKKGNVEAFCQPTIVVGRAPDCHLVFPGDRGTSAHHAVIRQTDGKFELVDSHSTNGTFVNDMRIQHTVLEDGDVIRFGVFGPLLRVKFPAVHDRLPGPVPDLLDAAPPREAAPARPVSRTAVHELPDVAPAPQGKRPRYVIAALAALAVAGLVAAAVVWWK